MTSGQAEKMAEEMTRVDRLETTAILARGIAHDFNHILGLIKNYLYFVEQDGGKPEDYAVIRDAIQQGEHLSKSLMRFSQADDVDPRILNVNDIIHGMKDLLGSFSVCISYNLADDLWLTKVDPRQLEQVILNLVSNARDAMVVGGDLFLSTYNERIPVEDIAQVRYNGLYAECDHHDAIGLFVTLVVQDSNGGIDAKIVDHIFDPFFSTKNGDGANHGLGLATVYGIVRRAGGWISVESNALGAKFIIRLPAGLTGQPTDEAG